MSGFPGKRGRPALAAAVAAALAGASGAAVGQVQRLEQLRYPPLPQVEIPRPQRVELPNGMVVMLLEDHELPLVSARALLRTGARLEPADKVGLAALAGALLRSGGTERMTPDELDLFLETQAASIESGIDGASGSVALSCLAEDFPQVLGVFADVLRRPGFDEGRLAVEKTQVETGIARQNEDPVDILFREFQKLVYGPESPYARTPSYASIAAVSRADLVAWHRRYFHPERVVLGLAGDFDAAAALALVEKAFGDWPRGSSPPDAIPGAGDGPRPGIYFARKDGVTQSAIAMGHLGMRRDDPAYFAVEVLNQVLSGSFASRLFRTVRSDKGLAYAVAGGVGAGWDFPGVFRMWMTTKVETTAAGIAALLEEARGLMERPPAAEEVAKAKEGILNSFVFNADSTAKILSQQLSFEYYGFPLDWLERYRRGIEAVTPDEVRAAAAKYVHPDRFAILVVGPDAGAGEPLAAFGDVTAVDITIPEPPPAGG